MNDILEILNNRKNIENLISNKGNLVPFIGAGFSRPICPGWSDFLDFFFNDLKKNRFLTTSEVQEFEKLKANDEENRLEKMADFLVQKAGRLTFRNTLENNFNKSLTPEMKTKFDLFYTAFPKLKITTNFDSLIEANRPEGKNMVTFYGYQTDELNRMFTCMDKNSLLKIHGDIGNPYSIVLTKAQYESIYGDPESFNPDAVLPKFLERVFTNSSVLFLGCSLETDRTMMILKNLKHVRPHFAILLLPSGEEEQVQLNRRMSALQIIPIWITDFDQINTILHHLSHEDHVIITEQRILPEYDNPVMFVGREIELKQIEATIRGKNKPCGNKETLEGKIILIDGAGGVGKTTLAIEAARLNTTLFKDGVLSPFRTDELSPMAFVMELAQRLNEKIHEPRDKEESKKLLDTILKDKELLLVLDNVIDWKELLYMLPRQTFSTIIITTRNKDILEHLRLKYLNYIVQGIRLERFTLEESLKLFQQRLGKNYNELEIDIYEKIAWNLGFLPIALCQAITLMQFSPHYTANELLKKLSSEDRLKLLQKGNEIEESDGRTIEAVFDLSSPILTSELKEALKYISICSVGPVSLSFLQALTSNTNIGEIMEELYTYSWVERREREGKRSYELHQLVRELVKRRYNAPYKTEMIRCVHEMFTDESVDFRIKDENLLQLEEAFRLAFEAKDERLKDWLSIFYDFCKYRGYGDFYFRLTEAVEKLFIHDKRTLRIIYANRARLLRRWGKLSEAMALHKKEEKICEELDDIAGLSACYDKQTLILRKWGKLDEAMLLSKKEEEICTKLGNKAGLAASYNSQSILLRRLGKLDEAMELHKKEEMICLELGDKAGLSKSYYGQALVLKEWGKFDESMVFHKKDEAICEELGDRNGLARSYGNQGDILQILGKLDEALALHIEDEKICMELGDRTGLAICYWNKGKIYSKKGDSSTQIELWKKSIEIEKSMDIPTDKHEAELNALIESDSK